MTETDERELRQALDDLWGCIAYTEFTYLQPETVGVAKDNHTVLHHEEPERNPYFPPAPEDGHHLFENGSYRCKFCAVYNRPDVPSTKEILDQPCKGNWDQSGKMRAWAEDKWAAERGDTK